ncbi:MAG: DUF4349 domain-containing protein [Thiothrix sp.]|nr:MAG: DUF4349 domain-containing protein [Thiothrix sp.]
MAVLTMKKRLLILLLAFLALWALRLSYGYLTKPNGKVQPTQTEFESPIESFDLERKNYASSKLQAAPSGQAALAAIDQKYEKVGTLTSVSPAYDQDEKALYELIKQEQLMIQFEQRAGLTPARQLNIALGVIPDKFDSTIEALRKIGDLKSIQIDKNDKTNEYKKLEAERISLQKARETLLELRQKDANTGELISLTNQLLEVEKQIQALGVSLGDFDEKNEFCTVKFSLKERRADKVIQIGFLQRAKVALEWTVGAYFMFWLVLFLGLGSLWFLAALVDKVKQWNGATKPE